MQAAMRMIAIFFFGSSLLLPARSLGGTPNDTKPPNIILILIDDMGWGDFSCFGNRDAKTPHIDRMAQEGIRFSQFYVNAPICSPSRCAITTGQYPQRWKLTSFLNNRKDNAARGVADWLDPAAPTLARLLQRQGYATGHFGKWHLGGQRDVDDAPAITSYGFDQSLTNFEGMGPKLLPLTQKPGEDRPGKIWGDAERLGGPVTWMQRSKITSGYIDQAIPFIEQAVQKDKPFFIHLWPDDVHAPFWPPVDRWSSERRDQYHAVLEEMDRQFAKLFAFIRDTPSISNNTILLICSDNGPDVGAGSSGPFLGGKTTLYEGGIRSPLIVWGPSLIAPNAKGTFNHDSVLAAFDLVPSLLSLSQRQPGKALTEIEFDGEDLSSTLLGFSNASRKEPLYWRRPPDRPLWKRPKSGEEDLPDLAIREGDWKLLCEYDGMRSQLYDLKNDPGETTNLADKLPEIVEGLTIKLLAWHRSMPSDHGSDYPRK